MVDVGCSRSSVEKLHHPENVLATKSATPIVPGSYRFCASWDSVYAFDPITPLTGESEFSISGGGVLMSRMTVIV